MNLLRWPWEIYGALYVLCIKFYAWKKPPNDSDRDLAGSLTSVVKMALFWGFMDWYEVFTGQRLNWQRYKLYIAASAMIIFDYWFFHTLGFGKRFEEQFSEFSSRKQITLQGAAILCLALLVAYMIYTRSVYMRTFHIVVND